VPERVEAPARRRMLAVAASAVFASATGLGIFTYSRRNRFADASPVETARGGLREYALREGSQVTLNTMTRVRPHFTSDLRRIDLDRGEALFHVTKDPARPFIVYVGDVGVRAIGTIFSVRRLADDSIRLLVTEGVVEVSRGSDVLGRVHAGIEFALEGATSPVITTLDPASIASALAWRQRRIDLQGLTLAEAVREFSRYSDVRIEIADPAIAGLHITGVFASGDPQGFAQNAALSLGLKSARRGNLVTISKD
jgi:transmembrane sensor